MIIQLKRGLKQLAFFFSLESPSLRSQGALISEPRFSAPCDMRFFPRDVGKRPFSRKNSRQRPFPFIAWEKSRHRAGVEIRGSLSSAALALRVVKMHFLGPVFGRTGFSPIFIFEPPIFSWILSPDFFSFSWEEVPRETFQENPQRNPPIFIPQKSSDMFLQIGQGNISKWVPTHTYFKTIRLRNDCISFTLHALRHFAFGPRIALHNLPNQCPVNYMSTTLHKLYLNQFRNRFIPDAASRAGTAGESRGVSACTYGRPGDSPGGTREAQGRESTWYRRNESRDPPYDAI